MLQTNIIYLRLSSHENSDKKNTERKFKTHLENLLKKFPELKNNYKIFQDVVSAYNKPLKERKTFNHVLSLLLTTNCNMYVISLDRITRDTIEALNFYTNLILHSTNRIYSHLSQENLFLDFVFDKKNDDPTSKVLGLLPLILNSYNSESESYKFSQKVKRQIVEKEDGKYSLKTGKKWGQAKIISQEQIKKVRYLKQRGRKYKFIQSKVKNINGENISISTLKAIVNYNGVYQK